MSGLRVVWHEAYDLDLGPHVFPTRKYRLVRDRLLAEGTIQEREIEQPAPATPAQLALVHTPAYLRKIETGAFTLEELTRLEVPFTAPLRDASILAAGGTLLTGRRALERGIAVHLGGGFHHAHADHGEGFCLLNDVAVTVRALQAESRIERAAVVDCDVHQGNGTADILRQDPRVFTFSLHQENNYPLLKAPGTLDVGLEDGAGDHEFLWQLEEHLPAILAHRPELVIYLAGADPYEWDQLGGLRLTLGGLRNRDELVLSRFRAAAVPVAIVLAGGYALSIDDTVGIHCTTVRAAAALAR